jgi:hypothetical protein
MKKINFLPLLSLAAIITLMIISCDKKSEKTKHDTAVAANESVLDCTLTEASVNGSGTDFNYYSAWTPTTFTIPSGPQIKFEGFSNSFIRPVTANWYIGTIALADTCNSWASIKGNIVVRNGNEGDAPDTTGFSPCNVVGINGTFAGVDYGLGYYSYNSGSHVPTVNSTIVIWNDAGGNSDPCYASTPANLSAPQAYIIRVRRFVVTGSAPPYSDVVYFAYKAI